MTGFGRASPDVAAGDAMGRVTVEVRSVNHRGFDLKIRTAEPDAFCDAQITARVRAAVERGTVVVTLREDREGAGAALDVPRIRQMHASLEDLRRELGLSQPVDLATVAAFAGGWSSPGPSLHGDDLWRVLAPVLDRALAELVATRDREGAALGEDLRARAASLAALVSSIETNTRELPQKFARRLSERLEGLRETPGLDGARIAQEVALLADRLDVSEELVRLRTHLEHFGGLLRGNGAVGRKLDFVIQEIGRELNTIGSKAQDAAVAALVIDAKAELEKMREQAQNIE
jgi:uncharacterized protein (TIGR00255 family)